MKNLNLKNSLSSILAPFRRWRDRDPAKIALYPYRDWRRMVIGWVVCLGIVLALAAYTEIGIKYLAIKAQTGTTGNGTPVLNEEQLQTTRKILKTREEQFLELGQAVVNIADPAR
jgi:hypothetical protein